MCEAYLGEIRIFSFGFAPNGWAKCDGQLMSIQQNQALYAILGVTYGGDGTTNFALPNLQGRVPVQRSDSHPLGQTYGELEHMLAISEMPEHTHSALANNATADQAFPSGNYWGTNPGYTAYSSQSGDRTMAPEAVQAAGASLPHPNMSPYLTLNFCIALTGIFPSRD